MSFRVRFCNLDYEATLRGGSTSAVDFLVGRITTLGIFMAKSAYQSRWADTTTGTPAFVTLKRPLLRSEAGRLGSTVTRTSTTFRQWGTLGTFAEVLALDTVAYDFDDTTAIVDTSRMGTGAGVGKRPAPAAMVSWEPEQVDPGADTTGTSPITRRRSSSAPPGLPPSPR
jgi:hypothetical protein